MSIWQQANQSPAVVRLTACPVPPALGRDDKFDDCPKMRATGHEGLIQTREQRSAKAN